MGKYAVWRKSMVIVVSTAQPAALVRFLLFRMSRFIKLFHPKSCNTGMHSSLHDLTMR
jgi:hypothetical protein